jgi:hypothetical protein
MKDAVKITVIATGFREVRTARPRQDGFAASSFNGRNLNSTPGEDMDFPEPVGPADSFPESGPRHIMNGGLNDAGTADDVGYMETSTSLATHESERVVPEVISLESVRGSVLTSMANFEADDLDVPAFLRKRSDVM